MVIKVQFYNIAPEGAISYGPIFRSMAKLVKRHTSNVEIIVSNLIGSMIHFFPLVFPCPRE